MQDRYAGDLGDYGKYALLEALATGSVTGGASGVSLSLGVHWYRVPDENHLNDGKFTGYLERSPQNDERYRDCDPRLYDKLAHLVRSGRRDLGAVEESGILPKATRFFSRPLSFTHLGPGSADRAAHRAQWHADALESLEQCELVFLDPDNGLECAISPTARGGPKFTRLAEAADFAARGQSLVIYHHIGRRDSADVQVRRQLRRLADACPTSHQPFALRWHRGTSRAYLVVPAAAAHADLLARRARSLLDSSWSRHWSGLLVP